MIYDAEHFFDGYKANPIMRWRRLRSRPGGADMLVLCDTNGGRCPGRSTKSSANVHELNLGTPLGIHTHDDGGCAVANALAAVRAGARPRAGYDQRLWGAVWERQSVSADPRSSD